MKRTIALVCVIAFCVVCSAVRADYTFSDKGEWPASWPKELEPLRKQARTYEGPLVPYLWYSIPFTRREEFEAAWPHLVKVKSKGAPIFLVHRNPRTDFFGVAPAGVLVNAPPANLDRRANPEAPLPGETDAWTRWSNTTFITLVVDGNIVDLNRIPLPPDTPIIDERFKDANPNPTTRPAGGQPAK